MPRRNRSLKSRRTRANPAPKSQRPALSGRVPRHIEQMARELVKKEICPPDILESGSRWRDA